MVLEKSKSSAAVWWNAQPLQLSRSPVVLLQEQQSLRWLGVSAPRAPSPVLELRFGGSGRAAVRHAEGVGGGDNAARA